MLVIGEKHTQRTGKDGQSDEMKIPFRINETWAQRKTTYLDQTK